MRGKPIFTSLFAFFSSLVVILEISGFRITGATDIPIEKSKLILKSYNDNNDITISYLVFVI